MRKSPYASLALLTAALLIVPAVVQSAPPTRKGSSSSPARKGAPAKSTSPARKGSPSKSSSGTKKPARLKLDPGRAPALPKRSEAVKKSPPRKPVRRPMRAANADKKAPTLSANVATKNHDEIAAKEKKAPPRLKSRIRKMRKEMKKEGATFHIGYTDAMDRKEAELNGFSAPALSASQVQAHNKKAERRAEGKDLMVRRLRRRGPKGDQPIMGGPVTASSSGGSSGGAGSMPALGFAEACSPSAEAYNYEQYLTPVRNQGSCGSCWAFAAMGAYEGSQLMVNGQGLDMSEQHVLDCAEGKNGNAGSCSGGIYSRVWEWMDGSGEGPAEAVVPSAGTERTGADVAAAVH